MDIYFKKEYGLLSEMIENGECKIFDFKCDEGKIHHLFIKRKIPIHIEGKQYYDLVTPYGYGGPIILDVKNGYKEILCEKFRAAFTKYCKDNNIVSEFIRFHPIKNNAADFKNMYNPIFLRKTLGTNLALYDDPIKSEFTKSCRKSIRQALRKGITFRVTEKPTNVDSFIDIYYSTLKRDKAKQFYYFGKDYFDDALKLLRNNLIYIEAIYNKKTIAAGLYFISDGIIYIHLSGTLNEYLHLSPAYILRYAITVWGKENGYKLIFHGGGTSNELSNTLYQFKKQFAQNTEFDYYVGKKIWNEKIYNELCNIVKYDINNDFFPKYRQCH